MRALQHEFGLQRIAVVDVDGHHGDGTQDELYKEPVLYVSLHRYDGRFYPGTGGYDQLGTGAGYGYTANVPLPRRCGDAPYLYALHHLVAPLLRILDRPHWDGVHALALLISEVTGAAARLALSLESPLREQLIVQHKRMLTATLESTKLARKAT